MNATIEKIKKIDIAKLEKEISKEVEKNNTKEDQYCLKILDYFIF